MIKCHSFYGCADWSRESVNRYIECAGEIFRLCERSATHYGYCSEPFVKNGHGIGSVRNLCKKLDRIYNDAEMFGEDKVRDYTLKRQVHNLVKPATWWYYKQEYSIDEIACEIKDFFERIVLPFLDDYTSVQGFIKCYESGDKRYPYCLSDYVFVASAYVCAGEPEKGLAVLEKHLSKPGLRKEYAKAFEYFANS